MGLRPRRTLWLIRSYYPIPWLFSLPFSLPPSPPPLLSSSPSLVALSVFRRVVRPALLVPGVWAAGADEFGGLWTYEVSGKIPCL